jgi:hypothetical protein
MATQGELPAGMDSASSPGEQSYLYRGVDGAHPQLQAARAGIVIPGNLQGTASPKQHNDGGAQQDSPYTSWTRSLDIARVHANKLPGGVVLRVPIGEPGPADMWHWEWSPDQFCEQEILLFGIRMDAEVVE